jgi:hypothetical protein
MKANMRRSAASYGDDLSTSRHRKSAADIRLTMEATEPTDQAVKKPRGIPDFVIPKGE